MKLQKGDLSTPVMTLQRNLQKLGYGRFIPTGYFGQKTFEAVVLYQKSLGLPQTGIFDQQEASFMNSELIWKTAISCLGKDASPNDIAPDEFGCAESVTEILYKALSYPGVRKTVSTSQLYGNLLLSKEWLVVDQPRRGDVIISPTGFSDGRIRHGVRINNGHVGIVGNNIIMSNSSATGKFEENYTMKSWEDRYFTNGGYPIYYFRKI